MDPITYTLLVKASKQLKQLSLNPDSETEESGANDGDQNSAPTEPNFKLKQTNPDQTKPKQHKQEKPKEQKVTTDDQCEDKLTTTNNDKDIPTLFLTELNSSSVKEPVTTSQPLATGKEFKEPRDPSLPSPPLTPSLFPGLEPTIHFPMTDEPCELFLEKLYSI